MVFDGRVGNIHIRAIQAAPSELVLDSTLGVFKRPEAHDLPKNTKKVSQGRCELNGHSRAGSTATSVGKDSSSVAREIATSLRGLLNLSHV